MVRRGPDRQTQLVLLDHGLYRELSEGFRVEHCYVRRGRASLMAPFT
jgi:hypothetical protein